MIEDVLRYIDEEMTPLEKQSFEDRLSADPELRKQLKYARAAKKVSEDFVVLETLENIKKIRGESSSARKVGSNVWKWIVIIVTVILLGLSYWWMTRDETGDGTKEETQVLAEVYEEPIWPLERSQDDLLSNAVRLHFAGRTPEALDMLLSGEEVPDMQKYWAAEIMVHDKNFSEAFPLLKELYEKNVQIERVKLLIRVCTIEQDMQNR